MSPCFNSRTPGGVRQRALITNANKSNVSIHAPREGCDFAVKDFVYLAKVFQFTHPGRGATVWARLFSISVQFQFTHPGRGATNFVKSTLLRIIVSIHAPREGCDAMTIPTIWLKPCFNSRTPGGVRLDLTPSVCSLIRFQFTHPGRGATVLTLNRPTI